MKQALLFLAGTILSLSTFAQTHTPEPAGSGVSADRQLPAFTTTQDAGLIVAGISKVMGLTSTFRVKASRKVMNVEAVIRHHQRYILYNPAFIDWLNTTAHDKWAAIALVAHEMGHHLNGHTRGKSSNRIQAEMEADEFAGFVLHKLGASLEQAQLVMYYISKTTRSATHPARQERIAAIATGWQKAGSQKEETTAIAANTGIAPEEPGTAIN